MARKRSYYKRKYKKYKKSSKFSKSKRKGMQRTVTYKFPARQIGGDRAMAKLRYVIGNTNSITTAAVSWTRNLAFGIGAADPTGSMQSTGLTINGLLGATPNLSQLAALYTKYRIRGIKLKFTIWPTTAAYEPCVGFITATPCLGANTSGEVGPSPSFATPNITNMPEQRWTHYKVINNAQTGAKPTVIKHYFSVNRVQGPDNTVKNDLSYTGDLQTTAPYWSNLPDPTIEDNWSRPSHSPWLQFGVFTMSGNAPTATQAFTYKLEATVYAQFWGKRPSES